MLVANHIPPEREVIIHSENGILGMGPEPAPNEINRWLINASKKYVTLRPGGAYMHHADSFAIIRGGHLDLCILGAFQVAENGDFANWSMSPTDMPSVGGAMDLAVGAKTSLGGDGPRDQDRAKANWYAAALIRSPRPARSRASTPTLRCSMSPRKALPSARWRRG